MIYIYYLQKYIIIIMFVFIRQLLAIFKKNIKRHLHNKKKLLSQFIFPLVICAVYYFYKKSQNNLNPLKIIMNFLLTIYLGLINSSSIKQIITFFINQREQGSRQYQYVMGLCKKTHTLANIFYLMVYSSIFLFPFYVMVNLYGFKLVYIFNFAAFVISSNFLTIALTSLFKQHKIATEVIGILFSLASFLPFLYDPNIYNFKHYLAIIIPNSSFTLAILTNNQHDSFVISMASLVMWKFYLLFFYVVQFREDFIRNMKQCCKKCISKIKKLRNNDSNQGLMKQIQQIQSASDQNIKIITPTLELRNVRKQFGDVVAVQNISLKLYKSQIFGLLGRNGAGKTTLVDMITNVTVPSSGSIIYNNNKNQNNNNNQNNTNSQNRTDNNINTQKISIGICYQHQILYQDLSVIDHLRFYSQIKNIQNAQQQITKIVYKVGIQQQVNKKIKQLSGGTKRKVSFCIALLGCPKLLIFDQPTSGLDPLSRRNIWQILQNIRKLQKQTTIILTTHHLDEADYLSDYLCIIKKGKIIQSGTPREIKQKYGRGYYLTINYNNQSNIPFDIQLINKIVNDILPFPYSKLYDYNKQYLKYFIKMGQNNYHTIIKCVTSLQRLESISIGIQGNSLEQSFIAINSTDATDIQQQIQLTNNNNIHNLLNNNNNNIYQINPSNISQIYAVILKNIYSYIAKFHWFYNMNIIILILITAINSLLLSKLSNAIPQLSQSSQNPQVQQQKNRSNSLFIITGYTLMSSAFLSIPVLQKQQKIIQLLRTRGLKIYNYWIGHFIFDFTYFCINYSLLYIYFKQQFKNLPIYITLLTASSMILYSYTISMLFNKVKTANSWFTIVNSLLWLIMMPLMMDQTMIQGTFYNKIKWIKYLFPYFDISVYLMNQGKVIPGMDILNSLNNNNNNIKKQQYTIHICCIIYFILFIILQSKILHKIIYNILYNNNRNIPQTIIQQIKLQNVCKKYKNSQIPALNNISYCIDNQKIGLLGHNGSGKSTTFGILTSQINVSQGILYLQNNLKQYYNNVMKSVGICYQQDTLWKYMTPMKIMKIFSYIVGINGQQNRERQINRLWDNMDIQRELKDRKIENLSGGNKRKICMAVCLLGNPKIKLLDQCSTGLDPVSRQSMVTTLKSKTININNNINNNINSKHSIILTTHSIPQAQQVCERAIIMKKGLVCQDNKIYKLKQKYYNCYWVQLIINNNENENENNIIQQIAYKIFNKAKYGALKINKIKHRIQIKKQKILLSQLMQLLYSSKGKYIDDFNIDQPKLQDVYLLLTADQNQNQNQNLNNQNQHNTDIPMQQIMH